MSFPAVQSMSALNSGTLKSMCAGEPTAHVATLENLQERKFNNVFPNMIQVNLPIRKAIYSYNINYSYYFLKLKLTFYKISHNFWPIY